MTHSAHRLLAGAAMLALSALAATPVQAQSAPQADAPQSAAADDAGNSPIIVTGSRIRRDPLDQSSPIVVLDSEALAKTGLSSVADIL